MKRIEGYFTYAILNNGKVWSYKHHKFLKQQVNPRGYMQVRLYDDSKSRMLVVHRLVAKAFIPNPENLPFVNHKNGDKSDNRRANLEWCTNQYNKDHAMRAGNFKSKLTAQDVNNIRLYHNVGAFTTGQLADNYKVTRMMIHRIVTYKSWKHLPQVF